MRPRWQKVSSAIALFLVATVFQVYVVAAPHVNIDEKTTNTARRGLIVGRLETRGNNPITVNDYHASTGATITPGAQFQTPEDTGATVHLGSLGSLEIAPGTNLTLNFDESSVNVALDLGYVALTTNEGINGSITTAEGKTERTDSTKLSTVAVLSGDDDAKKKSGTSSGGGAGAGAEEGGIISQSAAAVVGAIALTAAVVAAVYVPCRRGRNPSPGIPRSNECRRGF